MNALAITRWPSLTTTRGTREALTWPALAAMLQRPHEGATRKEALPGWAPATFRGDMRRKEGVERVGALGLDLDDGTPLDRVVKVWGRWRGVVHTTWSSTAEHPRARVVLALSREVTAAEHRVLVAWATRYAAQRGIEIDRAATDPSRLWFVPARSPSGDFAAHELAGEPLDVDATLAASLDAEHEEAERREREAASSAPRPSSGGSVLERARAYLARMDAALSGSGGHQATWRAAAALVCGFDLAPAVALELLESDFNPRCRPPWSRRELEHKVKSASGSRLPRGYLLAAEPPSRPAPAPRASADENDEPAAPDGQSDRPRKRPTRRVRIATDDERSFARGDHVELAGELVRDLERLGPVVFAEGSIHRYAAASGRWQSIDKAEQSRIVQGYAGAIVDGDPLEVSSSDVSGTIKLAADRVAEPLFFDGAPDGISFRNGFLAVDLDRVELRPHAPENRARAGYDFDFEPDRHAPMWLRFLEDAFIGDDDAAEKVRYLQQFFGACLFGIATRYQRATFFYGKGNNAKSKLTEIIAASMPKGSTVACAPQLWGGEYNRAMLAGKLLNVVAELPTEDIVTADNFKQIISGEPMQARRIYEAPFDLRPKAGHVFAANALPRTNDSSDGFWRRIVLVTFNRTFAPGVADKVIDKRIVAAELPAIVSWMVAGAVDVMKAGALCEPPSSPNFVQQWRHEANPVSLFLEAATRPLPNHLPLSVGVSGESLYRTYRQWCETNGHRPLANNNFSVKVAELGFPAKKTRQGMRYPLSLRHPNDPHDEPHAAEEDDLERDAIRGEAAR